MSRKAETFTLVQEIHFKFERESIFGTKKFANSVGPFFRKRFKCSVYAAEEIRLSHSNGSFFIL